MSDEQLIKSLVKAGGAATTAYIAEIMSLQKVAAKAAIRVNEIGMEDVYELGVTDTLERLKRNTLALSNLLGMAKDAAECVSTEIHEICKAYDDRDKIRAERSKEIIDREVERQRNRRGQRNEAQPE